MEILDIVNENDEVIGQATREEIHRRGLAHRQIHIVVYNNDGKILCHQRSDEKDNYPGFWDIVIGGHVGAGETYLDAAKRELTEELGLNFIPEKLKFCNKKLHEHCDKISGKIIKAFSNRFLYNYNDEAIKFDITEIQDTAWRDLNEIIEILKKEEGDFSLPVYKYGIEILEENKNKILGK